MRIAMGAVMSILMMIGLAKAVYDRYWRDRFKAAHNTKPVDNAPIENPFLHPDWHIRAQAIEQLEPTPDNIEKLLSLLADADFDVRTTARDKLIAIGTPAVNPLLDVLQQGKLDARQMAAEALGKIGDKTAIHGLVAATDDESKWVRLAIVEALGQFSTQTTRKKLVEIGNTDADNQVRDAAKKALQ